MYLRHYGLRDKPFRLAHDPAYYYSPPHQEPLNDLCYSIEEHHGLATLVGNPGSGKTMLLKRLLSMLGDQMHGVLISDTSVAGSTLLSHLGMALGLPNADEKQLPILLTNSLRDRVLGGRTVVVMIDEAQSLTPSQLRELHFLTNLEIPGRKLAEIVLAGHPALDTLLEAAELAALRQRVVVRSRIDPLSLEQTRAYIEHRLQVAGSTRKEVYTPAAIWTIHRCSGGVPRLINIICDRALLAGYAQDRKIVDVGEAELAAAELQIDVSQSSSFAEHEAVEDGVSGTALHARLQAIEEKLERLVRAMRRAGFLPPQESKPRVSGNRVVVDTRMVKPAGPEPSEEPSHDRDDVALPRPSTQSRD